MQLWTHNLKVPGSNPGPATNFKPLKAWLSGAYLFLPEQVATRGNLRKFPRLKGQKPNKSQIFGVPHACLGALWCTLVRFGAHPNKGQTSGAREAENPSNFMGGGVTVQPRPEGLGFKSRALGTR
jgi:hypothetical protein